MTCFDNGLVHTFWIRFVGNSLYGFVGVVSIGNDAIKYIIIEILTCKQTNYARITVVKLREREEERERERERERKREREREGE